MNLQKIRNLALAEMPDVETHVVSGTTRFDVIEDLAGANNIGIELGVAAGTFSAKMVKSGRFAHFFGVDVYGDTHDTVEYKKALAEVGMYSCYKLLRMTFDEALDLFDDGSLDFVYVDGFAHTGEEGGKTLVDWYQKLKVGGIMAGDDYHDDWPLVKWAVNDFARQASGHIFLTENTLDQAYSHYPSWYLQKDRDLPTGDFKQSDLLLSVGASERARIDRRRAFKTKSRAFLKKLKSGWR